MKNNNMSIQMFCVLASNFVVAQSLAAPGDAIPPGGAGCMWIGPTPSDSCTLSGARSESNIMDPPRVDFTTASQEVRDFDPAFIHRNNSCTPTTDTYAVNFEVKRTETWSVETSTTVSVATEMRAKVSAYSVAELETGIKTSVSQTLAMGFSLEATVRNSSGGTILQTVPPKNVFSVLPLVTTRSYIVVARTYGTVNTYNTSCGGGPSWDAIEGCSVQDVVAYATLVNGGASYQSDLDQFGVCSGDPDTDNDGIPDVDDPDIDGDGWANEHDEDIDGNGTPNTDDPNGDNDGDGIPNGQDDSPNGPYQTDDIDGDGDPNHTDPDMDGDGKDNDVDDDIDGDGVLNDEDPDADGDGIADDEQDNIWGWLIRFINFILTLLRLV